MGAEKRKYCHACDPDHSGIKNERNTVRGNVTKYSFNSPQAAYGRLIDMEAAGGSKSSMSYWDVAFF